MLPSRVVELLNISYQHMHEHPSLNCIHSNLKYCEHCDIVYCTKCKGEWSRNSLFWQFGNTPAYNYPIQVTCTTSTGKEDINHFHD